MKKFYLKQPKGFLRNLLLTALTLIIHQITMAQNLVTNSNFAGGLSTGWSPLSGYSMEVTTETIYGGPSNSNYVTEIDVERTMTQQVCILPGLSYTFTYNATRRPGGSTPASPGIQVKVTGVTSNTNYLNNTQLYNNTAWNMQAKSFTFAIPAGSSDKKVNIQFLPNNNSSTYGVILSDIEMAPASSNLLSIIGPSTTALAVLNNYSLSSAPAGTTYAWTFSGGANHSSSSSATPTGITWSTVGSKTVSVGVSNGTCTMATYSLPVNVSALLSVELSDFNAQLSNNTVLLTWVTGTEVNGRYFIVERASDGSNFDSIGTVTSLDVSGHTYQFTDKTPGRSNLYRLHHADIDGKSGYSQVVSVETTSTNPAGKMQLFPNPAISIVNYTISRDRSEEVIVQVFGLSGVLLMTSQQQLSGGNNQRSINVSGLKTGNYFLKVINTQGSKLYIGTFSKI